MPTKQQQQNIYIKKIIDHVHLEWMADGWMITTSQ